MKMMSTKDLFKKEATKLESFGRKGDTLLGHLTPGDVVIPKSYISPRVEAMLKKILEGKLDKYTAGNKANSINPKTGLPEFAAESGTSGDSGTDNNSEADTSGDPSSGMLSDGGGFASPRSSPNQDDPGYTGANAITGISGIDAKLNDPLGTALNLALGAIPGVGPALGVINAITGFAGQGTFGGAMSAALRGEAPQLSAEKAAQAAALGAANVSDINNQNVLQLQKQLRQFSANQTASQQQTSEFGVSESIA